METREEFAKQYENREVIYENNAIRKNYIGNFLNVRPKKETYVVHPYSRLPNFNNRLSCEEPIDLTQSHKYVKAEEKPNECNENLAATSKTTNRNGKLSREFPSNPQNLHDVDQIQGYVKNVIELQTTQSNQDEIMKAAKSLFSKRTRTLYHWMYPNTPKHQIKQAVINMWENLANAEKQFYISQVLVKFGFPQCNLMVNPQLGGIKELPPLPDTFENNFAAKELRTAISSISDGPPTVFEGKRRQGRPPGSKNKKNKNDAVSYKLSKDFQDDPELSKELEKFAISFDCFK